MNDTTKVVGIVEEALGGARFRVRLEADGREVVAYVAGRMKRNNIQVFVADRVEIVLDPAGGHATNRIVWRR